MKKTILTYGIIGGLIVSSVMAISMKIYHDNPNCEPGMVVGFASMIAAFSLMFVGIKNYRDKYLGGMITFGKAFKVGILIALITATMYVITWLIVYHFFIPDFMEEYSAMVLRNLTKESASAVEIAEKTQEMRTYREMYKNPLFVILLTYSEVFPVGLLVALISAAILKRKPKLEHN